MYLSCCIWALSGDPHRNVTQLQNVGFEHIDIRAIDFQDSAELPELPVSSVGLSFALPDTVHLDDRDMSKSIEAGGYIRRALDHTVWAEADCAYVVPTFDPDAAAVSRFAGQLVHLADQALDHNIRICIEHFPGRALPTVASTLSFIKDVGHTNLYLLLDVGHAQISREDPVKAIESAGDRLGYVHFDDNDGKEDLHLGLCEGILTETTIERTIRCLHNCNYQGGMSIELKDNIANPMASIIKSHEIITRITKTVTD